MASKVDDVWASLKAKSTLQASRKQGSLPEVRPLSNGFAGASEARPNVADGPIAQNDVKLALDFLPNAPAASTSADADAAAFLAPLHRDVNCLTDPDRSVRQQAVRKIQHALVISDTAPSPELLQAVLQGTLQRNIVTMLGDQVETCREHALSIITHAAKLSADFTPLLPAVMTALKQRMGIGQPAVVEPSEEVRLAIAHLVTGTLVAMPPVATDPYLDDLVALVVRIIEDQYHEMKKAGFAGTAALVQSRPPGALEPALPKLLEPIIQTFRHPHSRVRAAATAALSSLLRSTPVHDDLLTQQVVPGLKTIIADRSSGIRDAACTAAAEWLGAPTRDGSVCEVARPQRYAPHLVPVLLLGVTDTSADVAAHALSLLDHAGQHYCAVVLDAASAPTGSGGADGVAAAATGSADGGDEGAAGAAAVSLPAPFTGRAPAPARRMVQHQLPTILSPVLKDMREWTVALRLTASRSMYAAAAFAEAALLPHLPVLLPALCNAVGDQDETIALRVISTAQIVGAFCEVRSCATWWGVPQVCAASLLACRVAHAHDHQSDIALKHTNKLVRCLDCACSHSTGCH